MINFWIQKSNNLMINDFDISKELRFKLLGIKTYIGIGFKVLFFTMILLKTFNLKKH